MDESLVKKEGIQKEQGEKSKDESRTEPKKGRSRLQTILGVMAFIAILSLLSYESSQGSSASSVHINGIDYHYYDPGTGANWTYFMPGNYSIAAGSSINGTYPFTSNLNCSMTFTNVSSLTPGFVYQIHDLGFFVSISLTSINSSMVRLLTLSNESNRCVWENGDSRNRNECVRKRVNLCGDRMLFKN